MALQPFTRAEFLRLWKALLPEAYTQPIEASESGLDIPASHAAIWAKVEESANLGQQAYFIRPHSIQTGSVATSGVKATGEVVIARAAPALGDLVIGVGTALVGTALYSFGDPIYLGLYRTTAETALTSGTLGPVTVAVEAEFPGYTGNLAAGMIADFAPLGTLSVNGAVDTATRLRRVDGVAEQTDRFDGSLVGRHVRLVGGTLTSENARIPRRVLGIYTAGDGQPGLEVDLALDAGDLGALVTVEVEELVDLGVTVTQPNPISNGVDDALGAIGADRGTGKTLGETDEAFRARLQTLADIISPASHVRILDRILGSQGIDFEYLETRDIDSLMGFTWDVHPYDFGQVCPPTPAVTGSEYIGRGGVWLGPSTLVRFFVVCVPRLSLGDFGFAYDATSYFPGHPNAWDLGFFDGSALGYAALLGRVWDEINAARAAGVSFLIIQDGSF